MTLSKPWAWGLGILLVLSVGINLFIVGFAWERWRSGWRGGGGPPFMSMGVGELPREVRGELRQRFFEERGRYRDTIDQIREKRREIGEIIRAERLDVERLRARMAEMRQLSATLQERAQDATVEEISRLSPEQRAAIGERGRGGWWGGGGGWGGHGGGGPGGMGGGWR